MNDLTGVLIATRPEHVSKILWGEKDTELRKTKPKLPCPFKCYLYMSAGDYWYRKDGWLTAVEPTNGNPCYDGAQKVVAEFICDRIDTVVIGDHLGEHVDWQKHICLTELQMAEYLNGSAGYGWHISNLKVYDTPKEVTSFQKPCNADCNAICEHGCPKLTRPPQSWCYVQNVEWERSKVFYFVDVLKTTESGKEYHAYYGKGKKELPLSSQDNIAWYVKEYGFDTAADASKELLKIDQFYSRNGFLYSAMNVAETRIAFSC